MLHDASGPAWRQTMYLPLGHASLESAELAIVVLGRFASTGGFDLRQTPKRICLHLIHAGDGIVEMGDQRWRAGAGTAFCMYPGVPVHYLDLPGKPWRYTWIHLGGTRAVELASALGGSATAWCREGLLIRQVGGLLDEIEAAFRSEDHSPFYPQAAAWRLLDALSPPAAAGDRTAHLAAAVRRILDEQYAAPLKLGALAKQLGVDRSTVFRRFQGLYGQPPKAYLDRLRLEHAAALLRDGALGVGDVARRCGYASAHRFAKAFRARFGVPPSRYREKTD
jgi:AraC-like DNA-binding protein